jgi:hypothetical protein
VNEFERAHTCFEVAVGFFILDEIDDWPIYPRTGMTAVDLSRQIKRTSDETVSLRS